MIIQRVLPTLGLIPCLALSAQAGLSASTRDQCVESSAVDARCTPMPPQPWDNPDIQSGPSPYTGLEPDQDSVKRLVRQAPFAARRALNLARGAATARNGGLRLYRSSSCMYTSTANNPCLTHAGAAGIEFNIPGGTPGWEELGKAPAVMTRILVSADGRSLLQIEQHQQQAKEAPISSEQ